MNKKKRSKEESVNGVDIMRESLSTESTSSSSYNSHLSSKDEATSSSSTTTTTNISEETIYDFYTKQLYPAIISSLPILCKRIFDDSKGLASRAVRGFVTFLLPKWNTSTNATLSLPYYYPELPAFMSEFWNHPPGADFLLRQFDTNHDGTISANELTELMKHWPVVHTNMERAMMAMQNAAHYNSNNYYKETWGTWFSREWPLMDWKIGVFIWKSFGGILFLLAVLTIVPGRTHGISARILRWPVLGLTYFLISVELMVYVVIRTFIFLAENLVARPKHRKLRHAMSDAQSYKEWHAYASQLDKSQKRDKWLYSEKIDEDDNTTLSHRYNWVFIRELVKDMRKARAINDPLLALAVIQQCTRKNVGGIMSEDIFSYSNTGEPKSIVSNFVHELCMTLSWITNEAARLPHNIFSEDDDITLMSQPDAITYKENQRRYAEQVKNENNKVLLQSLLHATLSAFNGGSDNNNNTNGGNNSKKRKDTDDSFGKVLSMRTNSESDNSSNDSNSNTPRKDVLAAINHPESINNSNTNGILSAVHRHEVLAFLKRARQAYGRTALCLSGGAMMGLYHFGHAIGLLESGILPNIISGTSGGSVVGAILCTRTDEELKHDLNPEVLVKYLTCFARPWRERFKSVWENGNLFDFDDWMERIQWFTCGQMTFEEAYKKTGRIFCVTLSSTTKKAPPVLVNYLTAPNVTIASAVIASAAVPGFVPPVRLQYKDKHGVVRSQEGETFFDGSIEQDIPVNGLAEMFNCQFFVACQCNPHIVPFFYNCKGGVGRPSRWSSGAQEDSWRGGFLLAALEMYLKNDMKAKFRFLRDLEAAVGFTSTLLTQEFVGSTTIVPQIAFKDYFQLFSDPSLDDLYRFNQGGAVASYEHTAMIKLHYSVADTLEECIEKLEVGNSKKADPLGNPSRSILFIPESKRSAKVASTTPMAAHDTSNACQDPRGSLSTHSESDDEDDYERDWVTKGLSLRSGKINPAKNP